VGRSDKGAAQRHVQRLYAAGRCEDGHGLPVSFPDERDLETVAQGIDLL
jgi:hypothetical protein